MGRAAENRDQSKQFQPPPIARRSEKRGYKVRGCNGAARALGHFGHRPENSKGKELTTRSGLRADMRGEEAAEGIELSTDKMEEGREKEELEEEEEELSSLS